MVRRTQGAQSLAKKYGAASVEAACAAALEVGVFDYRFERRYLDVRYDNYGSAERPPHCKFPP